MTRASPLKAQTNESESLLLPARTSPCRATWRDSQIDGQF